MKLSATHYVENELFSITLALLTRVFFVCLSNVDKLYIQHNPFMLLIIHELIFAEKVWNLFWSRSGVLSLLHFSEPL